MADPVLEKRFSERGLNQAVAIASMCVQEEGTTRPLISDVMIALSFLSMSAEDGIPTAVPTFKDKSMSIALSRASSSYVSLDPTMEDDDSCTSSGDESYSDNEKERVDKNMKKKHEEEEDSLRELNDGSESDSDDGDETDRDSLPTTPIDENNAAQSLKIKYRYSWEEVGYNHERLSSKSSSNDESTSSRYDSDKDHDDSPRKDKKRKKKKREREHAHLEHIPSSKTDDDDDDEDGQSVYFDDDDDSRDDNADSLHPIKSEGGDFFEDVNGGFPHEIKSDIEVKD